MGLLNYLDFIYLPQQHGLWCVDAVRRRIKERTNWTQSRQTNCLGAEMSSRDRKEGVDTSDWSDCSLFRVQKPGTGSTWKGICLSGK